MTSWFGPKTAGYGIGPTSWQGWVVSVLVIAVTVGAALVMTRMPAVPRWIPLTAIVLDLVTFIGIIVAKTESD